MAIVRAPFPRLQFKADDGSLMSFCWLKVFIAGTDTQVRTYKDESGTLNPIEIQLDNRGECDVWIDDDKKYRFELWSVDRKRRVKTYNGVSAGYMGEAVPNVNITSPNNTLNIASSVDPETEEKVFSIDVNGNTIDIIKWSEVLAAEDKATFETRIQADLTAGIEPIVLDEADPVPRIATLSGRNIYIDGQFSVFRTATNESTFTNYIPGTGLTELRYLNSHFKNGTASFDSDAGLVLALNNRNMTYTYTGSNTLDFVVSPIAGMAANFAVKITSTAQTDGTVTVYKNENGLYTPLKPSVAGGTTVEAGKTYQLTCVGDCWTLAKFEEPEQVSFALIGGRRYPVVKIGNQYWMTENLDWKFGNLDIGETTPSDSNPQANYYDDDESTYGVNGNKYGLLYNFPAVERLAALLQDGWRVPTVSDWNALITSVGGSSTAGTKLKSTTGWDYDQNGDGSYGFEAFPAGFLHVLGSSGIFSGIGNYANFWTSDEFSETNANVLMFTSGASSAPTVYDKNYGCSVRLVKDA